jgi:hypothetical protein
MPAAIGGKCLCFFSHSMSNILIPLKGFINEVKIWNVALSQAPERTFMNTSLPALLHKLVCCLLFYLIIYMNKQGHYATFNGTLQGTPN